MAHKVRHPGDVARLVRVAAEHRLVISPAEAEYIWDIYSDWFAAGWLILSESDETLWHAIESVLEEHPLVDLGDWGQDTSPASEGAVYEVLTIPMNMREGSGTPCWLVTLRGDEDFPAMGTLVRLTPVEDV